MVRLEVGSVMFSFVSIFDFNSKMVRLEENKGYEALLETTKFQFQNGTIRRRLFRFDVAVPSNFNSKMVRLEENLTMSLVVGIGDFNSKMVRLEVLPVRFGG